ncbi:hypothetical protein FBZ94_101557 [Bradyrhizobium sacchari]|uniref:Uncharacterized protein n=1 Tax=Bradyrhizobium sacchari TaxID=1399419 RepID=A0A560J7A1_9BRAD|nr:hypothetical protein FBZ94_101557 [Bradyrhizobium sacchari]TWB84114.1 hypothetical protein FBZ95_101557 [Bradyrhizobium sacchari]
MARVVKIALLSTFPASAEVSTADGPQAAVIFVSGS